MKKENRISLMAATAMLTEGMSKMLFALLIAMMLPLAAMAQQQSFTETFKEQKLEDVLQTIQKKTGVKFVYNSKVVKEAGRITASAQNETVQQFLTRTLQPKGLEVLWQDGICVIKLKNSGKMIHVYGTVIDYNGDPIPGVTVRHKDTHNYAVTDKDGNYHITCVENDVLRFSFIGMKTRLVVVERAQMNVKLEEDMEMVNDVVVTGYQNVERTKLTSAITTLKMEDINNPALSTIDKMLEGRVSGMIFMQNSGQVGATPKLRVRGTSTLIGNREPVWVLDGVILSDPVNVDPNTLNDPDAVNLLGNAISGLNPNDIEEINI